jgi:enamine deaminase RidA (YjgF/YER057c/UK114 family)
VKRILCIVLLTLAACSSEKPKPAVSKEPVSVRGWIEDVEGSGHATNPDMETARRTQIFQATSIWVDNADYVSGGVAENGSFILLDVPPGNQTIGFAAPGADQARVVLQNIPGNADVFIPGLILKKNGARVMKPAAVKVRVPARIEKEKPTGKMATVAGVQVPIIDVPIAAMIDRHDYPKPEGFRPVATFK